MAAKVKLGARPKDFKHVVTAPLPEGGDGSIEVTYVYRTQTEYGKWVDERIEAGGLQAKADQTEGEKFSMLHTLMQTKEARADTIMGACKGWNLDVEFSRASVEELIEELPGHAVKIIDDYRAAILDGRLGN